MNFLASKMSMGIMAIIAGILILVFPAIIGWVVGIYLIIKGILKIFAKK